MSGKGSAVKRLGVLLLIAVTALLLLRAMRPAPETPIAGPPSAAGEREPSATVKAERVRVADHEEIVGSVRSRRVVHVATQVSARVLEVARQAGERVRAGEVLVRLDDRESSARLAQAREALAAADAAGESARQHETQAEARLAQARSAFERAQWLLERQAATRADFEDAERMHVEAQAGLADAKAAVTSANARREAARAAQLEAEAALSHLELTAPIDGLVSDRRVEPGDLANPGVPLLVLLDPTALRVEAAVREGLIARLQRGQTLEVELPSNGARIAGVLGEILPAADPRTRTFEVRVDLPKPDPAGPAVHAGMYARLRVPAGEREVVRAPAASLARVGQLWTVLVDEQGTWRRRVVTRGAELDGGAVEVLSGLSGGERIGIADGKP